MFSPDNYFVSPYGDNHEQIKILFKRVEDIILNHYKSSKIRSPIPDYGSFDESIYDFIQDGNSIDVLLKDLELVFSKSMNHITPNYIGHMDTMPTVMSLIGTLSTAAINNNMLGIEMSPVLSRMEDRILKDFAKLFGFGYESGGVMGSGGSLLNLQAMTIARNSKLNLCDGNVTQIVGKPILFASEIAHSSIEKNMMILGLGKSNLEKIKIDSKGKMLISHLNERLDYHVEKKNKPFCIVATLGTTILGSIDPIEEISDICDKYNLWLHADAIYGGGAILSNKYKKIIKGIEKADSIAFNPQKWMLIAKTCSLLLFKNRKMAFRHFKTDMPYISSIENNLYNLGEISIQGSRTAEILKLWLSMRHIGKSGYEKLIDKTFDLTYYFEELIDKYDFLEKYTAPETNTLLFRIKNNQTSNTINSNLQKYLLNDCKIYFSLQKINGNNWLKFMSLNPYTNEKIIMEAIDYIGQFYFNN